MPYKPVNRNIKIKLGVALDDTDFKTEENSIAYNAAGLVVEAVLEKADGTIYRSTITPTDPASSPDQDYDWKFIGRGTYELELPASGGAHYNNGSLGILTVHAIATDVLPFQSVSYDIVPEDVYDAIVRGTDNLHTNVQKIANDSGAAAGLKDLSGVGYDAVNHKLEGVKLTDTTTASTEVATKLLAYVQLLARKDSAIATDNSTELTEINADEGSGSGDYDNGSEALEAISNSVSNIGAASGGAVNFAPMQDNTGGAIDPSSAAFVGSVASGTFASVGPGTDSSHSINDTGNDIDIVYGYQVGGNRQGNNIIINADVDGGQDQVAVRIYDHVGTAWETLGEIDDNDLLNIPIVAKHTGTGSELGKVYIRFETLATTPANLEVFECLVAAVNVSQSVGYSNGRIFVDTNNGTAGTTPFLNGTADKPVLTWADALTLSAAMDLTDFHIVNGSTITLSANSDNFSLFGDNWNLALGGQSIESLSALGAYVTGIGTATVTQPNFAGCSFGVVTIPPAHMHNCGFGVGSGQFTAGSVGQYVITHSYSLVPGSGSPAFVFTGLGSATGINNRGWTGGSTYTLDSDCTLSHEVLAGGGQTITTGGADVELRGIFRSSTIVLSGAGTVQQVGVTGVVTISGTATTTVNLYGISSSLADSSVNTTVNDNTQNTTSQAATLADTNELQTNQSNWLTATDVNASQVGGENVSNRAGENLNIFFNADNKATSVYVNDIDLLARTGSNSPQDDLETLSDKLDTITTNIGSPANIDSGGATIADNLKKMADDNGGGDFDAANDSLNAIRARGDAAWVTGGGGAISQIINAEALIPLSIDLANTATVQLGYRLVNSVDDLPTTGEITPGTISIDRKAIGGTSWASIVSDAACSESAGLVYYDEVFDSGTGYAEGDSIRITFKSQSVTADANTFEVTGSGGVIYYTEIRQTMVGTTGALLASNVNVSGGIVESNIKEIDDDAVAAQNLESACDNYSATRGLSGTSLPAAAADAAGGLPISDAGGLDMDIALNDGLFNNSMVYANDTTGTTSTVWPYGTPTKPTDTIANAKTIADANLITRIHLKGGFNLAADMEGYSFYGNGNYDSGDILNISGYSIERSTFQSIIISGANGGDAGVNDQVRYLDCYTLAHTNINGAILEGAIDGACSIIDTGRLWARNCYFGLSVSCTLTLQAPTKCVIENPGGVLALAGMDGGDCEIYACKGFPLTINSSCTAGTIIVYGDATVVDNSGAGCSVTQVYNPVNTVEVSGTTQTANDNSADINNILVDTGTTIPAQITSAHSTTDGLINTVDGNVDSILTDTADMQPKLGTPVALDGGAATLGGMLTKMADDNGGADYDAGTDSLQEIRDRGDAAWTTGGGASSNPTTLQTTTIATLASQTGFTLTAGSADDNAYNNCLIVVTDASTSTQKCVGVVNDYTGSTRTIALQEDPAVFTMAAGDAISIIADIGLKALDNRTIRNANFFFQNGDADTTKIVNDVGVAGSGYDPDTKLIDGTLTMSVAVKRIAQVVMGTRTMSADEEISHNNYDDTAVEVSLKKSGNTVTRTLG